MTSIILTSELSKRCNDVITFIAFVRIAGHQEIFFGNHSREHVPPIAASMLAKFEQIL